MQLLAVFFLSVHAGQSFGLAAGAKLIGQTANRVQTTLNKATGKLNHRQLYQASVAVMPDGKKARQKNHFGH
jgi:hypothetical protein